ncbi:hypothetical protein [Sphingomonas sp. Leaf38]|uniref:hypothetical protein n=1 Tax=Sphingomonas sp. Leaf38 TaxID=1736217 RepID=UPI0006F83BEE|nr:hypothetical protein [Sphingomonas sp. Leaf38]KQN33591.1 hypothetical protein ASE88_00735 [Sphingomonas sp. Leaf38]
MATQLKHTDFAYTPAPAPRPNIRVAFIAGEATTAVHDAMAKLPAGTRDGTLEDLVWDQGVAPSADVAMIQSMTCSLIETARDLLSPAMYTAFLRWGETASHACSFYTSDDDGDARCAATAQALADVSRIPAENAHDLLFMMHLTCIETVDAPSFGPFDRKYGEFEVNGAELLAGLSRDLRNFSPIPDLVNELTAKAWDVSKTKLTISKEIGAAITSAFVFARGEDGADRGSSLTQTDLPAGYDRYMRGPFIAWQKAFAQYEEARDALHAYDRDVHTPTFANIEVVDDVAEQVQEQYDTLLMAEHDAIQRLYRIPAPSASELAIKLKVFEAAEGWVLTYAPEAVRRIAIDARRFGGHGAHLQTDQSILAAFAARRHEFEAADKGPWAAEQEDAYFGRIDAAEMVLLDTRASTIEGTIAKLRVAFLHQVGTDWSDLATSNTADPKFVEGLRMSGMYERMAWGAIEDLARIAGVSLPEQGA